MKLGVGPDTAWGDQEQLQAVQWAGDGVVFVRNNDIYYKPDLAVSTVRRVTDTGIVGVVYNGATDWLYRGVCWWGGGDRTGVAECWSIRNSGGP